MNWVIWVYLMIFHVLSAFNSGHILVSYYVDKYLLLYKELRPFRCSIFCRLPVQLFCRISQIPHTLLLCGHPKSATSTETPAGSVNPHTSSADSRATGIFPARRSPCSVYPASFLDNLRGNGTVTMGWVISIEKPWRHLQGPLNVSVITKHVFVSSPVFMLGVSHPSRDFSASKSLPRTVWASFHGAGEFETLVQQSGIRTQAK